jgi:DNA-binding XRE family transcriptional regulator
MPGLVKIGHTTTSALQRKERLDSETGVPGDFDLVESFEVEDSIKAEGEIRRQLCPFRLISHKEFYEMSPAVAKDYVSRIIQHTDFGVHFEAANMTIIDNPKRLGLTIRRYRKIKHMRQRDLASKAKTGLRFIVDIEKGKTRSQIGKIFNVLSVLGIQVAIGDIKE